MRHNLRTIAFVLVRSVAELVLKRTRERLPPELKGAIAAYRSGYLAERRRQIEAQLADGRLRAVVATNALELGLDIGVCARARPRLYGCRIPSLQILDQSTAHQLLWTSPRLSSTLARCQCR